MKRKRIILICSALFLALAMVLGGCGKKEEEPAVVAPTETVTESQPETTTKQAQEETTTKQAQEETTTETTGAENYWQEETSEDYGWEQGTEEGYGWEQETEPQNIPEEPYFTGYSIQVNLAYCVITVYECYSDGNNYPIRTMLCSRGRDDGHETPEGVFYTSDKFDWGYMADGSWAAYVTRFNGDILFHAVPSWEPAPGNMEIGEYNKLGGPASLGCVRLCVADAAWIYYNMPWGTEVVVYSDYENPGPWGIPGAYKIPDDIPQVNQWDPTDPDPGNPWPSYTMSIGPDTVTLPAGSTFDDLYAALSITDNYGNSVLHYATINADGVDYNTAGNYAVAISITLGSSYAEKTVTVTITG